MSKCPGAKCGRKLVNSEQCPHCFTNFHPNCLKIHLVSCIFKTTMEGNSSNNLTAGVSTASPNISSQTAPRQPSSNNFQPLEIQNFHSPPELPANWKSLSADDKSDLIMTTLLEIRNQNTQLKTEFNAAASKINFHSEVLQSHDSEINRISAEQADCRDALADRSSLSDLIVSGILKNLTMDINSICERLFAFLELDRKYIEFYFLGARFVRHKKSQPSSNSIVIEMISDVVCEKVLAASAAKRKSAKLSIRNILDIDDDSIIYINRMLPPYLQNVAFQARQAKKRLGWKSVSTFNGNVSIKMNDNSPLINVCTLAQLENLTK